MPLYIRQLSKHYRTRVSLPEDTLRLVAGSQAVLRQEHPVSARADLRPFQH